MATGAAPQVRFTGERRFYTGMALAMASTIFVGFAPTYYLAPWNPALPPLSPLLHLHGLFCTSWILLLVAQSLLIGFRRPDIHKLLGSAALVVVAGIVVTGVIVALTGQRRVHTELTAGTMADPYVFLIYPLTAVGLFAAFAIAGLINRRRPEVHKRLMLLATMSLTIPAIARISLRSIAGFPGVWTALLAINLFLIALAVHDLRTRGRLHEATLWGGGLLLLSEPLRIAIGFSAPWQAFAGALMA